MSEYRFHRHVSILARQLFKGLLQKLGLRKLLFVDRPDHELLQTDPVTLVSVQVLENSLYLLFDVRLVVNSLVKAGYFSPTQHSVLKLVRLLKQTLYLQLRLLIILLDHIYQYALQEVRHRLSLAQIVQSLQKLPIWLLAV